MMLVVASLFIGFLTICLIIVIKQRDKACDELKMVLAGYKALQKHHMLNTSGNYYLVKKPNQENIK